MNCDITFCNRECSNKKCERNLKYINKKELYTIKPYISIANFDKCKNYKESEE